MVSSLHHASPMLNVMLRRGKKEPCWWTPRVGPRALACALSATLGLAATVASAQKPDTESEPANAPASEAEPTGPDATASETTEPVTDLGAPGAGDAASESGVDGATVPEADEVAPSAPEPPPAPSTTGTPPPVVAADPNWHGGDTVEDDYVEPPTPSHAPESSVDLALGAQVFNPRGKVMSGPVLRIGEDLFWVAIEFSPIWLVEDSPDFDRSFLGNQWGFHFELAPLRTRRFELLAGLGLDVYHLWGIHGDEALYALTAKLHAQFRMTERASMFATLRGYPLSSEGLELGRDRRGDMLVPLLGSLGVEWRWP